MAAVKVEEMDGRVAEALRRLASPSPSVSSEAGSYGGLAGMSPSVGPSPADSIGRRYCCSSSSSVNCLRLFCSAYWVAGVHLVCLGLGGQMQFGWVLYVVFS